jgi:ComF family protein
MCGHRLSASELVLCNTCNLHLPRTGFSANACRNEMARLFWGQIPVERAAALFFYERHAQVANLIHQLKYKDHPEVGVLMGRLVATEFAKDHFFNGLDGIVPVPISSERLSHRGYNQSMEIAKGVSAVTGLPIFADVLCRETFADTQTAHNRWARMENVAHSFKLTNGEPIAGKHLLVIDDVVTTGATVLACAKQLVKAGNVKISVLTLGCTKR